MRRRLLIVPQHLLDFVKHLRFHDRRNSVLNSDLVFVRVDPNVFFIFQHSTQAVVGKWPAAFRSEPFGIECLNNLCYRLPLGVEIVDKPDSGRGFRVNDKLFVRPCFVAQWTVTTGALCLGGAGPAGYFGTTAPSSRPPCPQ